MGMGTTEQAVQGEPVIANQRYWLMIASLLAATLLMHFIPNNTAVPLTKPLRDFPVILGPWHGHDSPFEPSVIKEAGVDDYLNRTYENAGHPYAPPIFLYVGYYKSQQSGDGIHSPQNCLPGSGWEPQSKAVMRLPLREGSTVAVNVDVIQKGLDREIVMYWYQSHGRIVASDYWARIYLVLDAIRYHRTDAALIRIITPMRSNKLSTYERLTAFALQAMTPLRSILPH